MKKFNIVKKVLALLCVLTVIVMTLPVGTFVSAFTGVYLSISAPSNYNPTAGGSVSFTLTYSGDVGNIWLTTGSVVLNGFTANKTISGTGNTRVVTLSNLQGVGSGKYIQITGGTAISSTGDLSNAANSVTSGTFTINPATPSDTTAPVLSIIGPSAGAITVGQSVTYTARYTDNVGVANISLGTGSIVLNGFTANKSISVSGNDRIITLTNVQGTVGSKSISITGGTAIDAAGNLANSAGSAAFSLNSAAPSDSTAPVLTITGPNPATLYAGQTVAYTARYTDNVGIANISLSAGSIVLNGFTANKSITVSGNDRIITLTNIQGTVGSKSISITGGTAIDAAGNLANSAGSAAFNLVARPVDPTDTIAPVLTLSGPNPLSIFAGETVTYTATYSDNVGIANIWLTGNSIVLSGFTANIRISGTGNTRTIILSDIRGAVGADKKISITGGTAIDAAGNLANAVTSLPFSIKENTVVPPADKPSDWVPNPNTGIE